MKNILTSCAMAMVGCCLLSLAGAAEPDVDEWFERDVRPLLAERCLSCHSSTLEAPKANLKLDRRELALAGGDSGPAIEVGKPADSLLIMAVRGEGVNRMPPDRPLTKPEIATLERWISLGAPWPQRQVSSPATGPDWLKERAQAHWAWQSMRDVRPPQVQHSTWPSRPLDAFIMHKLESLELEPASQATPTQLLRRISYDLTGLPPSAELWQEFSQAPAVDSPEFESLLARTVDQLIASPQFGVTWGRHWFDLVRYCETLGHEFDYPVRYAWRYRDAVIDAFNDDVPYDRLVMEHLAGDVLPDPRRHVATGINQSLAMTTWWWMGEGLHAPVDVWGDEATRLDNQIDVYSKTFLGLTVACARCHDHKFDPLSAADYTSLVGVLQSSRRTYSLDDPKGLVTQHNQRLAEQIQTSVTSALQSQTPAPTSVELRDWLKQLVERWQTKPTEARQQITATHPLYPLILALDVQSQAEFPARHAAMMTELRQGQTAFSQWESQSQLLADFSDGLPGGWYVESADQLVAQQGMHPGPLMTLDPLGVVPARPGVFASHTLGKQQQLALRSPTFDVTRPVVAMRMRGKGIQSTVMVDNYFMIEFHTLLFGDLRKPVDQPQDAGWVTHGGDLKKYLGHPAYISIEDDENSWFELSQVRLADTAPPPEVPTSVFQWADSATSIEQLLDNLAGLLSQARDDVSSADAELMRSLVIEAGRSELPLPKGLLPAFDRASLEGLAAATPAPTRLLGIHEGTPRDAVQFMRGNPHKRGAPVPRADLQALGGHGIPNSASSGRMELAHSLTSNTHPLTARVMVNRVWLQLLGQGLVDSPDNFGLLGGAPSNLELLDYLSLRFIEHNWSLKWLVTEICNSRTYRLSSRPSEQHELTDPTARYLSHRQVRRLSGEKLRDALLAISGSLDHAQGGESIPVYLTEQMTGRGRPGKSGPLDGQGRRAVYIELRRNFLDPFLVAFDQPPPATTVGKRNMSNVPAQALSLLNAPLVHEMARRWSQHICAQYSDHSQRIRAMYISSLSREPSEPELRACLDLIGDGSTEKFKELAHVIVCTKEFQYLQ